MYVVGWTCVAVAAAVMFDYILMRRKKYLLKIVPRIILLFFFIHITLAVLYNDWDSGFQYYFFTTLFSCIFIPSVSVRIKIIVTACCLATYVLLGYASISGWVEPYPQAAKFSFIYFVINTTFVFSLILILAINYQSRLRSTFHKIAAMNETLERLATTDPLTGLLNRRSMTENLEILTAAAKEGAPYSVLLLDVDHFKKFNDCYGHDCGDLVLKLLSSLLNGILPPQHITSRWGGEEFLITVPASKKKAFDIAEKVRTHIEQNVLIFEGQPLQITVTIGVTSIQPGESAFAAITRADHGLLRGKAEGRNRVIEC
ncbi:hypothetical protein GCM10010969_11260 [Saccharibacillus kuerlensis]|uniref:GGDEF domain-containing protein n=2 Tax=Saccharibacillus kuerlensis TaxID=459527 RepID=A0ABQ2KWK8_9BACL|nr:hypothetical protein GCM10010969_11260 [Saccharibacillus kuerlensis]